MKQKPRGRPSSENIIRDIKRKTSKHYGVADGKLFKPFEIVRPGNPYVG